KAPDASFPLSLRVGIVPKHIFAGMAPEQIQTSPYSGLRALGTGPFKVASINQLAITLDRNPSASPQPPPAHQVLRPYPAPDPRPIPTAGWAYSAGAGNLHPFDAITSAKALDAAGWVLDPTSKLRVKNSVQFKVTLVAANSYPNQQIAEAVASQLGAIGVGVDVKPQPASKLLSDYLLTHKYQMALVSIDVGPDPDQYSLWHSGIDPASLNFAYSRGWGLID